MSTGSAIITEPAAKTPRLLLRSPAMMPNRAASKFVVKLRKNKDQLVQVFLNLAKNAAEAIQQGGEAGEILFTTAFRPGIRLMVPGTKERITLPLEVCVHDTGPGVPEELRPNIFDPFVTTKPGGRGLGLALVAKIVRDHGGIVECIGRERGTTFRVLLPMLRGSAASRDLDGDGTP